ncbi:MAG: uroporphyrinogen decarboxylase family protein [Candidatus Latescibacterota bacterium]
MSRMTRRERLTTLFAGGTPDRPAVKVWGAGTRQDACIHPAFEPVRDRAVDLTDLMRGAGSPFHLYCGRHHERLIETRTEATASPDWVHLVTVYHTPEGDLRQVFRASTRKRPGYIAEYPLKEPADIHRLLSLPYEPFPFSADDYTRVDAEVGESGIATFGLDHAMYGLQRLIGSTNFALWSLEAEEGLLEAMTVFSRRLLDHARAALAAGIRGVFAWVGPELCIPPLMPPAAFERYVFALDRPLIDLIRNQGSRVWVHCHGRMRPVLRRFAEMGIDVLNPIEPPPMGDVTLDEAFDLVGDRMGLEGNLETHDFMTATEEEIRAKMEAALAVGRGRRLILCPSSGYMENVEPSPQEIRNWLVYIEEGVRLADAMAA